MINTKEQFLEKYPKPEKCPMSIEEWTDGISYCWGYALTIDEGKLWDDSRCPCEFFDKDPVKEPKTNEP